MLRIGVKIQSDEVMWNFFNRSSPAEIEESLPVLNPKVDDMLNEHLKQFCWLPYMYEGPAWYKRYFIEVLAGMAKQNAELRSVLDKQLKQPTLTEEKQKKLVAELGVDHSHVRLEIAKKIVFIKGFKKDCLYYGMLCGFLAEGSDGMPSPATKARAQVDALGDKARASDAELLAGNVGGALQPLRLPPPQRRGEILTGNETKEFMKRLDLEKIAVEKVTTCWAIALIQEARGSSQARGFCGRHG